MIYLTYTQDTFVPVDTAGIHWLFKEGDYELARDYWQNFDSPLSHATWREAHAFGYHYAAVLNQGRIISAAAVSTLKPYRRRGYAKQTVAFVTAAILEAHRTTYSIMRVTSRDGPKGWSLPLAGGTVIMRHNRDEVIERTIREYELLDHLVANLSSQDWRRRVPRPESKEPWTVKDTLAHITHWKASVIRSIRRQGRPPEERGLAINDANHLIYLRWHGRPPREVLAWHRQVQQDLLAALREAPDKWFDGKERNPDWPGDLDGHSTSHRVKDIERALAQRPTRE